MAKFDSQSLFGVDIDFAYFSAAEIVSKLGLSREVFGSKTVKGLIAQHGRKHRIVSIAIRQVLLDELKATLEGEFLPYDSYYVDDALHTGKDQRYEAEEKFLYLMFSIARGKSVVSLKRLGETALSSEARSCRARGISLYKSLRQELNDHTRDEILRYKEGDNQAAASGSSVRRATHDASPHTSSLKAAASASIRKIHTKRSPTEPVAFEKEIQVALTLQSQASELITEQARLAASGAPVDLPALQNFCTRIIESYRRNPHALMCVRHIQNTDDYIAQHIFACGVLSCYLAHALQLDDRYVGVITLGGVLFDIGRFRLPKPITNKVGKLSDAEFALVRKHLQFGEVLLKQNQNLPKVVYQMLWDHHERVDGRGYPLGKKKDDISIYGKIGAIVDAYDALTSEQTFKPPMTPMQATKQLRTEAGFAFDEKVLEVFLTNLGSVPVGSCVSLSNGRLGFVLTLNAHQAPSLIRQVYSLSSKSYIVPSDIAIDKTQELRVQDVVLPTDYDLRFIDHIA